MVVISYNGYSDKLSTIRPDKVNNNLRKPTFFSLAISACLGISESDETDMPVYKSAYDDGISDVEISRIFILMNGWVDLIGYPS